MWIFGFWQLYPLASAILSYRGFNNLVGYKRIHKWFQKEVKPGPYCLLQHVPWIHITLTYRIHVESSPYAEAKWYPDITKVNFAIFIIYQLINLKLFIISVPTMKQASTCIRHNIYSFLCILIFLGFMLSVNTCLYYLYSDRFLSGL